MAADDTPLLLSSQAPESSDDVGVPAGSCDNNRGLPVISSSFSLEDTIEQCIGGFGRAQLLQAVLVSLAWVFDAQQTFINVFTDRQPSWHCINNNDSDSRKHCSLGTTSTGTTCADPCHLPPGSWEWDEPPTTSMVSEWDLTCRSSLLASLPASSFFAGCLLGGLLLATLADSRLGRKKLLLLSCLVMSSTGVLTAFAQNIWAYAVVRLISGFGRATIGTCALVLSTELVGKRWRGQVGVVGFFCFTLGFLSLPFFAFLVRDSSWRALYLWTSGPALFYCPLIHFLVHESPRWLFVRGQRDEAIKTLTKIAAINGYANELTINHVLNISSGNVAFCPEKGEGPQNVSIYSAMKVLWEKKLTFRRLVATMVVSFGIGLVYYAMPLTLKNLKFNLYLSLTFNALSELPATLLMFFLIGRLNRRSMVLVFTLLSGATSVACGVVAGRGSGSEAMKWVQIGLEVSSFFNACLAFNVLLIYTLELFPTCVRNSALSMVRQALVLGGVLGPLLVAVGMKKGGSLVSFGVFGLAIGFCGLFVVTLPETRGAAFCDTMEEQEREEESAEAGHDSAEA